MKGYPKVISVLPRSNHRLLVTFDNGMRKLYDCTPLLEAETFSLLREDWLFRSVRADPGGYGISWNDELDLSESELWENGCLVEDREAALN
jgi:hypothetical protein